MSTDPKRRGKRPKKRKFSGNQHTKPRTTSVSVNVGDSTGSSTALPILNDSYSASSRSATPTTTERKLGEHYKDFLDFERELKKGNETHLSVNVNEHDDLVNHSMTLFPMEVE